MVNCNDKLSSFEGFPDYVDALSITLIPECLMFLHDKMHEEKAIKSCYFYDIHDDPCFELHRNIEKLSDPFEFQDWCIENGYEEYL
jgi:hypothetical protein